jgi:hypothetical protein
MSMVVSLFVHACEIIGMAGSVWAIWKVLCDPWDDRRQGQ